MSAEFIGREPTREDLWRAIVLFGRNVASYKFALAASLLELRPHSGDLIRLEELAAPFSRHLRRHLGRADKQGTSPSSRFLNTLRSGNAGEISEDEVIEQTAELTNELMKGAFTEEERSVIRQLAEYRCRFDVYHFEQLVFVGRDSEAEDDDFMDPGALLSVMEKIASLCQGVVVDPQANTIL